MVYFYTNVVGGVRLLLAGEQPDGCRLYRFANKLDQQRKLIGLGKGKAIPATGRGGP
jgi:hypothetical protein